MSDTSSGFCPKCRNLMLFGAATHKCPPKFKCRFQDNDVDFEDVASKHARDAGEAAELFVTHHYHSGDGDGDYSVKLVEVIAEFEPTKIYRYSVEPQLTVECTAYLDETIDVPEPDLEYETDEGENV